MPRYIQPIAHKIDAVTRTKDVLTSEKVDFSALHLSGPVLNGLRNAGFERPSPIQLKAIPIGRIGLDVIAQAKAGTGKTCVFGVIVLEAMNIRVQKCQCIIVAPTREIAAQIQTVLSVLACDIDQLKCALVIGGTDVREDKEAVSGAHIIIGTPGRLLHLIEDAALDTECVRTLVLDEADKLVDESFYSQVKSLASQLPKSKQVLAMSATYHKDIDSKFHTLMRDPYYVRLSADNLGLHGIQHFYYTVKTDKVKHQTFCNKITRLVEILSHVTFEQCLVFSNFPSGAEEISVQLTKEGFTNQVIAGNMAQEKRTQAMEDFRECRFRVLISTDVTARGIDNQHVDLVINMDLPVNTSGNPDPHTYLHRAGRAGRFGKYGSAISIIALQKEHMFIQDLEEKYQVEVRDGPPYDEITELLCRSKLPPPADQPTAEVFTNNRENNSLPSSPESKDTPVSEGTDKSPEKTWGKDEITALRSSVKVQKKAPLCSIMKNGVHTESNMEEEEEVDGTMDGNAALTSLGSLGKLASVTAGSAETAPSEDDASVFNFSSSDVNTYQEQSSLLCEALGGIGIAEEDQVSSSNPSTCGSNSKVDTDAELSRSRRGSKKEKKARKPPKSLNMTSPKQQNGRRAQSAAAEFANSNILSPHTPKWRSEAVSSAGCIIHSKAINVKFLLENYLCLRYEFTEKDYEHEFRAYFPSKGQILRDSSTALCEIPLKDKTPISRFVSHGFVANNSEGDPLGEKKRSIPPPDESFQPTLLPEDNIPARSSQKDDNAFDEGHCVNSACSSSFGSVRQHPCARYRPTDIPHLFREQSKDSGVWSYTSPYHHTPYHPYSAPPYSVGTPYPPCYPPPPNYWNMWSPYPMCSYPPPQFCANCTSPHFSQRSFNSHSSSQFSSAEFSRSMSDRHTPCSEPGIRGCEPGGRACEPGIRGCEPGGRGCEPGGRGCEPGSRRFESSMLYEGRPNSVPSGEPSYSTWSNAWDKAWAQ